MIEITMNLIHRLIYVCTFIFHIFHFKWLVVFIRMMERRKIIIPFFPFWFVLFGNAFEWNDKISWLFLCHLYFS